MNTNTEILSCGVTTELNNIKLLENITNKRYLNFIAAYTD